MSKTVCKNCGHTFEGTFCNACGQKFDVGRIDRNYIVNDIANNLLQIDRGFFYTLKELSYRPGESIRAFLQGKRKQHFKPLAYLLITSALYVLVTHFLGLNTFLQEIMSGIKSGLNDDGKQAASGFIDILSWLIKYHNYTVLLSLPLFSLASWLAFKGERYNYFEHLVLNVYVTGQQMVIYLLASFLVSKESATEVIPLLLGVAYGFWAFYQFFGKYKPYTRIFLSLLTYLLFLFQLLVLVITLVILAEVI